MITLTRYVESKKDLAAALVFRGTRVTVNTLFDYLEKDSVEEFFIGFPTESCQQAEGVIEMAAE